MFRVDDVEWRKWANQHIYYREGISFEEMNRAQREAAFPMLEASLSAKGLKLTRDIMRLNETLGELNSNNFIEYGEWKYGSRSWENRQPVSHGDSSSMAII